MYRDNDQYGIAYADIFIVFEKEEGTTTERVHYKSLDGKYSIDYVGCGAWTIHNYELRYGELMN